MHMRDVKVLFKHEFDVTGIRTQGICCPCQFLFAQNQRFCPKFRQKWVFTDIFELFQHPLHHNFLTKLLLLYCIPWTSLKFYFPLVVNVKCYKSIMLTSSRPGYINVISWLLILVIFVQYIWHLVVTEMRENLNKAK